jgi:putative FmdB family regulatory protein
MEDDMPIYEFQCEECDEKFDKLHQSEDEPRYDCPKCGSAKTKRLMSVPASRDPEYGIQK